MTPQEIDRYAERLQELKIADEKIMNEYLKLTRLIQKHMSDSNVDKITGKTWSIGQVVHKGIHLGNFRKDYPDIARVYTKDFYALEINPI